MPCLPKPLLLASTGEAPCASQDGFNDPSVTRLGLSQRAVATGPHKHIYTPKQPPLRFPGTHQAKRTRLRREPLRSGQTLQRSRAAAGCFSPRSTARPRISQKPLSLGAKPDACF